MTIANATPYAIQLVAYGPDGLRLRGPWPSLDPGAIDELPACPPGSILAAFAHGARAPYRRGATQSYEGSARPSQCVDHARRITYDSPLAELAIRAGRWTLHTSAGTLAFHPHAA